jgi:uncharacterized linocin/CFP29 family protein
MTAQISSVNGFSFANGRLPLHYQDGEKELVTNAAGFVQVQARGVVANSLLKKDEWEELDTAIVQAQSERLNAIARLQSRGLVRRLGSIGVMASQWNIGSQMSRAVVNMTGQAAADMDRVDYNLAGVPVPVIHKEYQIGERQLEASRRLGEAVDVTNAYEAGRVVAEELERMFFGGYELTLNGQTIYGVTNETNVNTGSATGDFGDISNIMDTFIDMVSDAAGDNYHGPFEAWVSTTQYIEMMDVYTDGSGLSAMARVIEAVPALEAIHAGDYLTDGSLVMVQMTPNVVDLALYEMGMNVEWASGDGMTHNFKVMSIAVPRVKSDYESQSGIVYYTGA